MLKEVCLYIEGRVFDIAVALTIPPLIWWTAYGLKREDLSDELKEFWQQLKEEI